jgi:fatty acid amide hydrolase
VPISVKECFAVQGLLTTLGNPARDGNGSSLASRDARVVQLLQDAGAIVLGKTNVSQLMVYNECDNPRFGRTVNPWDKHRTCGGSSGGAAALTAAGAVALELGSDAGGSARVPAHFCGVHTLMPTPGVISRAGMADGIPGMAHLTPVPSPMARRVEDLLVTGNVLAEHPSGRFDWLRLPTPDAVRHLRVACWQAGDAFPVSPAIARAVEFAKAALVDRGATLVDFDPPPLTELLRYFVALWMADGALTVQHQVRGRAVDPSLKRMITSGRLPHLVRRLHTWRLRRQGDFETAELIDVAHGRTVEDYWRLLGKIQRLREGYLRSWADANVDAVVCPPYGLPALPHGQSLDLMPAACYAVWVNLFGLPAGVLSVTRVRVGEEGGRDERSPVARMAGQVERGSAGLPVGIQIVARPHCEQAIIAVMLAVEAAIPMDDNPAVCGPGRIATAGAPA